MKISTLKYFISDAFKSLNRNKTISIASAATVLTTLLVFGAFMLTALNVSMGLDTVQSKVEVKVYLNDNIDATQQQNVEDVLKNIEGVTGVTYVSKNEALTQFKKQTEGNEEILAGYNDENNPLPASFTVKLSDPNVADAVVKAMTVTGDSTSAESLATGGTQYLPGVESVGNDQDLINTIDSVSRTVRWVGIVLFIVLIGISLFLIMNTIKITVFSRRREIGIMKFVGATDWFIRWPFIIEGMVIGLAGAVFATVILYFAYKAVYELLVQNIYLMSFLSPSYVLTTMSWEFIVSGIVIGTLGSIIALRKFLHV